MSSLNGTPLEWMYTVFGVSNDSQLCTKMTNIGLVYTVVVGLYSVLFPAPYGRYSSSSTGPTINAKVAWMMQECMAFFCPMGIIIITAGLQLENFSNIVAIFLFAFHYFHRSFIYPLAMSSNSKPVPIVTALSAVVFCVYNGLLQGIHLANVHKVEDSFPVFLGTLIFLGGMAINVTHDRMLIALRKNSTSDKSSSETDTKQKYKIPRGELFEYVSGANYLGEIIEWIALAFITRGYPQIVFALFSSTFLGIRAVHHHRFYKNTFGNSYPQSRKAIIPFIL
ncbi:3-oxo-5-alpha-steroid 4-dehydrogenase 2 [Orchesella cincta]|uniref:3-oxo-5-alpha-steroid 4-dehydrogenase 2 n=1 Tax=Orchesella cincta TaxID=48709 RepID=A0A1D2N3Q6_ORCCI|nr:3-oxo-5-alpha-steroid 4-dehydrogenase 2 [Orchesella cincta]